MRFSVVIPVYNEHEIIRETIMRVENVLKTFQTQDSEIIVVNDGSTDGTAAILDRLSESNSRIRIIHFSRNFGHEAASSAGLNYSSGDCIFFIDADLQDPPELFPEMLNRMDLENADVVYGVRKSREGETVLKRLSSLLFYRIFNTLSEVKFPVDTGDFRLINSKVRDAFKALPEQKKYVRGLLSWVGFKQIPIEYERHARQGGTTKYNFRKLVRLAADIFFSFSKNPLKLSFLIGFICFVISISMFVFIVFSKFIKPLAGWASTMTAIVFFGGIQMLAIGILGEYFAIIFDEVKKRPAYIVDRTNNFDGA